MDDNGDASPDTTYMLDNFLITPLVPGIVAQPQAVSVVPGGNATLTVDVRGAPPLHYQWYKGATPVPMATNQSFTVTGAIESDAGIYFVAVSNIHGGVLSAATMLDVSCTPASITGQPQGQTLAAGGTVSLSVSATGTQPLSYQWYRGGAPVSGATNQSLIKSNALGADSGLYHVLVSNCLGNVASMSVVVSVADVPYMLVGLTNHFWRYDQSGTNLGAGWRAVNYDDSGWPQGRGVLAEENLAVLNPLTNTVLSLTSPGGGSPVRAYYFRTHIILTNEPAQVTLLASNYFDDGAVFYVNGEEAFRYNMPVGEPLYSTLALAANPQGEGNFIVSNLPPSLLAQGTNVLAVEVHQNTPTSSDVAFGAAIIVRTLAPTLLQITNQPADWTVPEDAPVSFSVGVLGQAARYQWFKDGSPLPGATGSVLSFVSAAAADRGAYFVVVSNLINVVTSRVASLVVNVDFSPPALLSADLVDATHVLAVFAEPMLGTATNTALYQITNGLGGAVTVQAAVLTNGTNVLLTTTPLAEGVNWILTASGVADVSAQQNVLPPSAVPVARTFFVAGWNDAWRYFEPVPPFTAAEPGPGWNLPGFDLAEWGEDLAAFAYDSIPRVHPVPVLTALNISPGYVTWFRREFVSKASPAGLTVRLRHAVDDGVVFYLNGVELHRFNLPDGPLRATNPALAEVVTVAMSAPVELPAAVLPPGPAVFAAQLHQVQSNATRKFFAAELSVRAESLLAGPMMVLAGPEDVTVTEHQPATFRVSIVAASALQWQVNGADWPGATNDTFTWAPALAWDGARVRCVCLGAGGTIFTADATLRVLPDLTRPVLLGAVAGADGAIVLSFSEVLDPVTAQSLGNYTITNRFGIETPVVAALAQGSNVWLTPGHLLVEEPVVVVHGVTDPAARPNAVAPGSAARIGLSVFLPFEAAWKYLIINTNEAVQSAFMQPAYDDSAWLVGQGALNYEFDPLPVTKGTQLPLHDQTGLNRINTYYFRQSVVLPLFSTGMVVQLRHVIDDGMLLHVNGVETVRYNIAAGPVTAATQAANVFNAGIVGPLLLSPASFSPGTNVLAVDVHQEGAQSSDVVMGLELRFTVPTVVLPLPPLPAPRLESRLVGSELILIWGELGYLVEQAASMNGPWQPVATVSPVMLPATNAAAFYRLRR